MDGAGGALYGRAGGAKPPLAVLECVCVCVVCSHWMALSAPVHVGTCPHTLSHTHMKLTPCFCGCELFHFFKAHICLRVTCSCLHGRVVAAGWRWGRGSVYAAAVCVWERRWCHSGHRSPLWRRLLQRMEVAQYVQAASGVKDSSLLGTMKGVFLPTLQNILGVILFLCVSSVSWLVCV